MNKEELSCICKSSVKKAIFIIALIIVAYGLLKRNSNLVVTGIVIFMAGCLVCFLMKNKKVERRKKKGALEMSIGTIVIIVIAITMLILGIVFVRSVMCGAIGLTGDLNDRVTREINKLFDSTVGEVQCVGASGEPVRMVPGKINIVYCGIKAPQTAKYSVELTDYKGVYSTKSDIKSWLVDDSWGPVSVPPGDELAKKVLRLNIPENAPEDTITLEIAIKKEGQLISTQSLDFQISRVGMFRAAMC